MAMISYRVRGLNLMHWLVQSAAVLGLLWVWALLFKQWHVLHQFSFEPRQYVVYSLVMAAACVVNLARSRTLKQDLLHLDIIRNHQTSLRQTLVLLCGLLFFLVAAKDRTVSRMFLFTFAPTLYTLLLLTNAVFPKLLAAWLFAGWHQARTLLLGSSTNAVKLKPWLGRKAKYGFNPIGLITDEDEQKLNPGCALPVLGGFDDIRRVLREQEVTQLIVLDLPLSPEQIVKLGNLCDKHGVRLFIVNDLEDKLHRSITFFQDDGFHFVGFRQEPLECPVGRALKRALDLAISVPVVVFVLPLLSVGVWLIHRTQSPGPLFFRQRRSGKHNHVFFIYKFRTMHTENFDEGRQAVSDDPRVFRAGRWLRKLSIDEIPQFLNVLKGEMSVVGPRPHFVDHDALFGEIAHFYRVRSLIKPGITGLAQVRGLRGEARKQQDLVDRIHSDLYYLEHWSVLLDWVIIFKTAWQMVFPPKSAY